jgi:ubiquinone biosynthesis protein
LAAGVTRSMADGSAMQSYLQQLTPDAVHAAIANYFPQHLSDVERAQVLESALLSEAGPLLRAQMADWIANDIVRVERLVPRAYGQWYPPVRDAMSFVVSNLSAARLAPKIVEQINLPSQTPPEIRVLRLIAKVPGIQKLGQVLARDRHLRPSLRKALTTLENGIHDVTAKEICAIIETRLGSRLTSFDVHIKPKILSEASVSAVVPFTWWNPAKRLHEKGVFKVLKPHIPKFFAEDMDLLQDLARFFGRKHHEYGFGSHVIPDTFTKVRQLLQHEVDFAGEQANLLAANLVYSSVPHIRVPQLIPALCAPDVTAMTYEHGVKVTNAAAQMSGSARAKVSKQLLIALTVIPLCSVKPDAIFHADPHAGNLLYDRHTGDVTLVDWALMERLSLEQRRHMALLLVMVALRDPVGACDEVRALSQAAIAPDSRKAEVIRDVVTRFLERVELTRGSYFVETMRLLQAVALKGVRFPAPLIMFSKVLFTLNGILEDIGAAAIPMSSIIGSQLVLGWLIKPATFPSPLAVRDWLRLPWHAALYAARVFVDWQEYQLSRYLGGAPAPA